jgi:hypothetical protein
MTLSGSCLSPLSPSPLGKRRASTGTAKNGYARRAEDEVSLTRTRKHTHLSPRVFVWRMDHVRHGAFGSGISGENGK